MSFSLCLNYPSFLKVAAHLSQRCCIITSPIGQATAPSSLPKTFSSRGVGRAAWGAWERALAFLCKVPIRCFTVKSKLARISSHLRIIPVGDSNEQIQVSASIVSSQDERLV